MKNKRRAIHILALSIFVLLIISIWAVGEKNSGEVEYVGTSENL